MLLEVIAALAVAQLFYLAVERHTGALRAFLRARLDDRGGAVVRRAAGP
jgi:hypothetical protein